MLARIPSPGPGERMARVGFGAISPEASATAEGSEAVLRPGSRSRRGAGRAGKAEGAPSVTGGVDC